MIDAVGVEMRAQELGEMTITLSRLPRTSTSIGPIGARMR